LFDAFRASIAEEEKAKTPNVLDDACQVD